LKSFSASRYSVKSKCFVPERKKRRADSVAGSVPPAARAGVGKHNAKTMAIPKILEE
jgi:hypothetical protein